MHVVVQQGVVAYGQCLGVLAEYFLNSGEQVAMEQVLVHVIDVIIIKLQAVATIIQK
tara:strand:- start:2994 stop:3164 length:171 start_codon:yes stop_codon:yes gene_type:complete